VVRGSSRGRKLGFPTANVRFSQELLPLPGVYVIDAEAGGSVYRGVANVGFSPTFGENSLAGEAHLFGFDGDLYGRGITVWFRDRIRDERKFQRADDLVRQILKDAEYARESKIPRWREARGAGAAERGEGAAAG
jgi:riboflavin kinase/FMN adenylyltransferase